MDCRSNNEGEEEDSGWEDFVVAERKREDKGGEPEEEDPGKRFAGLEERLARFMNELSN